VQALQLFKRHLRPQLPIFEAHQDLHCCEGLASGMMQAVSEPELHVVAAERMLPSQHLSAPPERPVQPAPPHFPHEASQQTEPSLDFKPFLQNWLLKASASPLPYVAAVIVIGVHEVYCGLANQQPSMDVVDVVEMLANVPRE